MKENNQRSKEMDEETTKPTQTSSTSESSTSMWRNPPWSLLIAALILLVIVIVVAINHKPSENKTTTTEKQSAQVSVSDSKFLPQVIDIKTGSSVTWTNQDTNPHWIASDPYPKNDALKSLNSGGPLAQNESYTYTFDKSGTFSYHDELHPSDLMGTIRVK